MSDAVDDPINTSEKVLSKKTDVFATNEFV